MGACCGGMKPGHKSLPEKQKSPAHAQNDAAAEDQNQQQQPNNKDAVEEHPSPSEPAAGAVTVNHADQPAAPEGELRVKEPDLVPPTEPASAKVDVPVLEPPADEPKQPVVAAASEPPAAPSADLEAERQTSDDGFEIVQNVPDEPLFVSEEGDFVAETKPEAEAAVVSWAAAFEASKTEEQELSKTVESESFSAPPPASMEHEQVVTSSEAPTVNAAPSVELAANEQLPVLELEASAPPVTETATNEPPAPSVEEPEVAKMDVGEVEQVPAAAEEPVPAVQEDIVVGTVPEQQELPPAVVEELQEPQVRADVESVPAAEQPVHEEQPSVEVDAAVKVQTEEHAEGQTQETITTTIEQAAEVPGTEETVGGGGETGVVLSGDVAPENMQPFDEAATYEAAGDVSLETLAAPAVEEHQLESEPSLPEQATSEPQAVTEEIPQQEMTPATEPQPEEIASHEVVEQEAIEQPTVPEVSAAVESSPGEQEVQKEEHTEVPAGSDVPSEQPQPEACLEQVEAPAQPIAGADEPTAVEGHPGENVTADTIAAPEEAAEFKTDTAADVTPSEPEVCQDTSTTVNEQPTTSEETVPTAEQPSDTAPKNEFSEVVDGTGPDVPAETPAAPVEQPQPEVHSEPIPDGLEGTTAATGDAQEGRLNETGVESTPANQDGDFPSPAPIADSHEATASPTSTAEVTENGREQLPPPVANDVAVADNADLPPPPEEDTSVDSAASKPAAEKESADQGLESAITAEA